MKIKKSDIEAVAVKPSQYPPEDRTEIAFAGRSNVGKSSLLNLITGRKNLARVSGSPGKTRTINFFDVTAKAEEGDVQFRIVGLEDFLGLAFIKLFSFFHGQTLLSVQNVMEYVFMLALCVRFVNVKRSTSGKFLFAAARGCPPS